MSTGSTCITAVVLGSDPRPLEALVDALCQMDLEEMRDDELAEAPERSRLGRRLQSFKAGEAVAAASPTVLHATPSVGARGSLVHRKTFARRQRASVAVAACCAPCAVAARRA